MYNNVFRHRIGLYEKALPSYIDLKQKLAMTKDLGFDFIELSIDESDERRARLDWDDDTVYQLRRWCEQFQLPIQSICLSVHRRFPFGSRNSAIRDQAKIHMEKAIALAYKLGVRTIQLAGYDVYYESSDAETHQRFIDGMKWSASLAERAGIMLAVEIMDTDYLNSLSKFAALNREVDSPFFNAYPDVGNISAWNNDVAAELRTSQQSIVQIHLKDTRSVTDESDGQFRDLIIGEGDVDFDTIFSTLKAIQCSVPLVVEMWANDDNWRENIVTAQQRLNASCERAGVDLLFQLKACCA
ncbi:L-ribulose-5-phosphate 3-epimerase [Photobacterium nomapromontoriensis]|uniref:L-ribulose-5-phosphate 3-epimerase n=1 Tax=Photobacterium nomapromontoriensis TaxID=2910237 RepID=UPI003D145258